MLFVYIIFNLIYIYLDLYLISRARDLSANSSHLTLQV